MQRFFFFPHLLTRECPAELAVTALLAGADPSHSTEMSVLGGADARRRTVAGTGIGEEQFNPLADEGPGPFLSCTESELGFPWEKMR